MEAEDVEQVTKTFKPGLAQGGLQDGVANPGGDGGDSAKLSTALETASLLQ